MIKDIIEIIEEDGVIKVFINGTELVTTTKKDFLLSDLFDIIDNEQSYLNISFSEDVK